MQEPPELSQQNLHIVHTFPACLSVLFIIQKLWESHNFLLLIFNFRSLQTTSNDNWRDVKPLKLEKEFCFGLIQMLSICLDNHYFLSRQNINNFGLGCVLDVVLESQAYLMLDYFEGELISVSPLHSLTISTNTKKSFNLL